MTGAEAAVHIELDEFWCSDCLTRALFERVTVDQVGSEWACTTCGAAYFDGLDLVVEASEPMPVASSA